VTKEEAKQIREIASRLPKGVVRAPKYELWINEGTKESAKYPDGTVDVEVNHERRLRRAYKKHGMAGVRNYFEYVRNQIDKQEQVAGLPDTPGS
jgi:hypothetical protein